MANRRIDGMMRKEMFASGAALLSNNRENVDALNVFPVPDGDTGTNMYQTISSAMKEINSKLEGYGIKPVSRNTLYGDIEELRMFGLDIITDQRGNNLCYFLATKDFQLPELKLLVDSVQASKFLTEKKSRELTSTRGRYSF